MPIILSEPYTIVNEMITQVDDLVILASTGDKHETYILFSDGYIHHEIGVEYKDDLYQTLKKEHTGTHHLPIIKMMCDTLYLLRKDKYLTPDRKLRFGSSNSIELLDRKGVLKFVYERNLLRIQYNQSFAYYVSLYGKDALKRQLGVIRQVYQLIK